MNINVEDNYNLVWDVIHKQFGGGKNYRFLGFEPEDLFQIGVIGLIKAVRDFDPSKNTSFPAYAYTKIYGGIRQEIRDSGMMVRFPRGVNEMIPKIIKQNRKETITIEEIMEEFDVNREYATMVMTRLHYSTVSGSTPLNDDNELELMDAIVDESIDVEQDVIRSVEFGQRLSVLNDRERTIVKMRLDGLTQPQIADEVGISQMHVSRLLKKATEKINKVFDSGVLVC